MERRSERFSVIWTMGIRITDVALLLGGSEWREFVDDTYVYRVS